MKHLPVVLVALRARIGDRLLDFEVRAGPRVAIISWISPNVKEGAFPMLAHDLLEHAPERVVLQSLPFRAQRVHTGQDVDSLLQKHALVVIYTRGRKVSALEEIKKLN